LPTRSVDLGQRCFHGILEPMRLDRFIDKTVKVVILQVIFTQKPGEENLTALERCYPRLISYREKLYSSLGDITLDYATHRLSQLTTADFLHHIEQNIKLAPSLPNNNRH